MFSAKRKKESKSEIPQWKLDMLAAESGGSAPSSDTVSAAALADAELSAEPRRSVQDALHMDAHARAHVVSSAGAKGLQGKS